MTGDFTVTLLVEQTPRQVFEAVLNVRGWWRGFYAETFVGNSENLNDEFTFSAGDGAHYTRQRLIEMIPDSKVVWLVTESELTFVKKRNEWEGTMITFEIAKKGDKTEVQFTHRGLTPEMECYDSCSTAWSLYLKETLPVLIGSAGAGASVVP